MIRIWKFKDAPQDLKDLYLSSLEAAWVLEVPSEMTGEVQDVMRTASIRAPELSRSELPGRTIIFLGQADVRSQSDA